MANGLCSKCGNVLTSDNCSPARFSHGGPCYVCRNQKNRLRYRNDDEFRKADSERHAGIYKTFSPEKRRQIADRTFFRKYGVPVTDFKLRLEKQNNECMICNVVLCLTVDRKNPTRACQDHDHFTNILRDILCNKCNLMLGYAKDDIEILKKAIIYLQRYAGGSSIKTTNIEADKPAFTKVSTDGEPVCST